MSDPTQDAGAPDAPTPPPAPGEPVAPPYGAPPQPYGTPAQPYGAAPQQPYGAPQQPYGAAPQYSAAPGYSGYPAGPKYNAMAIVSFVSSLVGLFIIPVVGQIVGIITGHISLSQLKTSGENGRGLALAGTIIGWVSLGLAVVGIILFFAVFLPFVIANSARLRT
jgi:hypothetical protein